MIKLKNIIKDLELGKVYTDKDRPPLHGDAEGGGVYSKPHDVIKLLQIAQKSLGKIK